MEWDYNISSSDKEVEILTESSETDLMSRINARTDAERAEKARKEAELAAEKNG